VGVFLTNDDTLSASVLELFMNALPLDNKGARDCVVIAIAF
jgi:hypothetical protein